MDKEIIRFQGKYDFLSNFYPCKVKFEGLYYPSVEHAYQAAKMTDVLDRLSIRQAETPALAKKIARSLPCVANWDKRKERIMLKLLKQKFQQRGLKHKLVSTGDAKIVEGDVFEFVYVPGSGVDVSKNGTKQATATRLHILSECDITK